MPEVQFNAPVPQPGTAAPAQPNPGVGARPAAPMPATAPATADNFGDVMAQHRANMATQRAAQAPQQPEQMQGTAEPGALDISIAADAGQPEMPDAFQPTERMVHGMKADEILAALENGEIPQALWDKIKVAQKINGEEMPVTIAEQRENGMRLSDYTRKQQELRRQEQEFGGQREAFNEVVQSWMDPNNAEATLDTWEDLGFPAEAIVNVFAKRNFELKRLEATMNDPNAPMPMRQQAQHLLNVANQQRQQRIDARRAERERALSQNTMGQRENAQRREAAQTLIQTHLPNLFQSAGIVDSPVARNHMGAFVREMLRQSGGELTVQILRDAVQATRETLLDQAKQHAAAQGQRPGLPAVAGAAPGGGKPLQPVGGTVSDFQAIAEMRRQKQWAR